MLFACAGFTHGFESEIEAYDPLDGSRGSTVPPDLESSQQPGGGDTPAYALT
jgi:hypothetical protein